MARIEKLDKIKELKGVDGFLISSAVSVKYFSGHFYDFETGPSPFQLLPAALLVIPGEAAFLIIADNEPDRISIPDPRITTIRYASYVYTSEPDYTNQFLVQLHKVIQELKIGNARIGIEQDALPYVIAHSLSTLYPKMEFTDIAGDIATMRMIKDADEMEAIRRSARLCDIGQASVVKNANPGMTELELFALVRRDIESAAGMRVPLMADLISGSRTSSGGGGPTDKIIEEGDLLLSDLTPCLDGYWGDSCSTIVVGSCAAAQRKRYLLVKEALMMGIDAMRPGVRAMDIDTLMRRHIGSYGHHSGHGVGVQYHEEPRITPYNQLKLLPDMVIALEPAIYEKDYGIRLEHLVVVREGGCEILTEFQHVFER